MPSLGGRAHDFGLSQAVGLPLEAATNRPGQDAGQFGPEFLCQLRVALAGGNRSVEGDDSHATPECIVGTTDPRPVVRDQPQLKLGVERERVLSHEPGNDGLAAGHGFDLGFVKVPVKIGFDGSDHAGTCKPGEVGGDVVLVLLGQQRFGRRVATVVAEHVADEIDEGRFAVVAAFAVHEKEDLLGRDAGQ